MRVACWIVLVVACGNDRAPVDPLVDTPLDDATILPDTPTPPAGCDWAELDDPLNDLTLGNGVAEQTHLTLTDRLVVCGRVDSGHLIDDRVDVDAFQIALAERAELRVELVGPAAALDALEISVIDAVGAVAERGRFLGTHAAFHTTLAPGDYRLVVTATNATELAAGFDYQLRAIKDPAGCARVTGTAAYAEAGDGPQGTGNDMIEISYTAGTRTLTTANNDDPEPSGVITTPGTDVRISGVFADVTGPDDFTDRDTYLIETGAHDELAVRVDWTGDADPDVFVFPEGSTAELGHGTAVGKLAPERAVLPVLANTRYWVWVGAYKSTTGLPIAYDLTLCATTVAP